MSNTLLTIKEVATRLALGRTTVYALIGKREIKTIKVGRCRRIPESALDEWIRQQLDTEADGKPPNSDARSTQASGIKASRGTSNSQH